MTTPVPLPTVLIERGAACGALLRERAETVAVAEGSCGGLISASLLAVPGASAYYLGGLVVYTRTALDGFLGASVAGDSTPDGLRGASEPWAVHLAQAAAARLGATWGIGEGGAAGPTGNRYGDPAGHAWLAVSGPQSASRQALTSNADRQANMVSFAATALELLAEQLAAPHPVAGR